MIINQLSNSPELAQTPLSARFKEAQEAFYQGQENWKTNALPAQLLQGLTQPVFKPAHAFYQEANNGFLPALQAGNQAEASNSKQIQPKWESIKHLVTATHPALEIIINTLSCAK